MSEKKSEAVVVLPPERKGDLERCKADILNFHEYARRCGKLAVLYAARCGFELLAAKTKLAHGKFNKFKEELGLPWATAYNYMCLAAEFEKRSNIQLVEYLKALKNPTQVFSEQYIALTESIQKFTDGKTLTQLYFDWGIKSTAQTLGGAHVLHAFLREHYPDHPEYLKMSLRDLPKDVQQAWEKLSGAGAVPTSEEANRRIYQYLWRNLVSSLRENGLTKKTYSYLMRDELEEVYGTLIDLKNEIMEALKK